MKKLLFPLFMAIVSMTASAAVPLSPFDDFKAQIAKYATATEDMTVTVSQDITMTQIISIPEHAAGHTLTIKSDATRRTITRGAGVTDHLFTVSAGAKLTMENIIIDGNKDVVTNASGSLVYVSASAGLVMNVGAVLQNNMNTRTEGPTTYGGGVYSAGTFTMNGGKISNNSANRAGGVYSDGTFTMNGGEINHNSASVSGGGVYVSGGTFNIFGENCKISHNEALSIGGGVYILNGSTVVTMTNGEISDNKTTLSSDGGGGGVGIHAGGTFNMSGGKITGNEVPTEGGGVRSYSGSFTMTGGEISNNSADKNGGGVYWDPTSPLTLGGTAKITGNKADNTDNNVTLTADKYITLGTGGNAPATGMEVGVQTATTGGVFVNSGATAAHEPYFFADASDKEVIYQAEGKLAIVTTETPFEKFKRQISLYANATEDMTVTVSQDLTATSVVAIPANAAGKTLTIKSADVDEIKTITRGTGVTGNLFTVKAEAKLTMENIIIDGNKDVVADAKGSLVYVSSNAEFRIDNGAVLQNNRFPNNSGSGQGGGGVQVQGTFVMSGNDSKICNNEANDGGGIYILYGTVTMESGEISYNKTIYNGGGGVCINSYGAFTMHGGKITGNEVPYNGGGGILAYDGPFTMTGGEISHNKASYGGGIYVGFMTRVQLALSGTAKITGNTNGDDSTTDNVLLADGKYITLGTGDNAPATGMNVGVQTATSSGVFVNSGATAAQAQYFFADNSDQLIAYQAEGKLAVFDFLGSGTEEDPYQINNAIDLTKLARFVNDDGKNYAGKYFKMTADIDLGDFSNWTPIGNNYTAFHGHFDGDGKAITNLSINSDIFKVGLFGEVYNGSIRNLGVSGTVISSGGNASVGALVGYILNGTITNCTSSTTVSAIGASSQIGGLVGTNHNGQIEDCTASGDVSGNGNNSSVGGFVGFFDGGGQITRCTASGNVSGGAGVGGYFGGFIGFLGNTGNNKITASHASGHVINNSNSVCTGGFAGYFWEGEIEGCSAIGDVQGNGIDGVRVGGFAGVSYNAKVTQCFASGDVNGNGDDSGNPTFIGGFAGYNWGAANCYAIGNVTGNGASTYIGGFAGVNTDETTKCYAAGTVTSANSTRMGGFAGWNSGTNSEAGSSGNIENCYYHIDAASKAIGGGAGTGTPDGKTTTDMQQEEIFAGWSFGEGGVWAMASYATINNGYPYLQWQPTYTVTMTVAEGYTYTVNGQTIDATTDLIVTPGSELAFTFTVSEGYEGNGIVEAEGVTETGGVYTLTVTQEDMTVAVTGITKSDPVDDPIITYHTVTLTTGTGIVIDKDKSSFQIQSGNPFSFVITLAKGYEGQTPTVTVNGHNTGLISVGIDKWRCILSEVYEDTDVRVSFNITGNEQPDAPQLYTRGGQLYIDTPTATPLRVYNAAGQMVANRQLTPGLTTLPLPTGIYIVQLDGMTKRVVVSNK